MAVDEYRNGDRFARVLHWLSFSVEYENSSSGEQHIQAKMEMDAKNATLVRESAPPCKSCREWKTACDRQRPRCSHCLHEQLMCFYIGSHTS